MLTLLMATRWVAHRIAHAIDAAYGVVGGMVACAGYGASLPMEQLLMRLGEYNRQSEAARYVAQPHGRSRFLAWSRLAMILKSTNSLAQVTRSRTSPTGDWLHGVVTTKVVFSNESPP